MLTFLLGRWRRRAILRAWARGEIDYSVAHLRARRLGRH
jgi:hypothetical protein